jgi:enamine deaminase RidA (YjgF/YER057c/UK114 family)
MSTPSERLRELNLSLPGPPFPVRAFLPLRRHGDVVYVSGQTPLVDGRLLHAGLVGADVDVERAREAARTCVLNSLARLDAEPGGLDAVAEILRVTGFVASAPGFYEQPRVIDAASELLHDIFGEAGRHARSALGVAALPGNAPVELELIVVARG